MKGLGLTFDHKLSEVEHRAYLRLLHVNLKTTGFKGKETKDALWVAAISTKRTAFGDCMMKLKVVFPSAHKYLSEINPALWTRHAFGIGWKSDMLLNNLAKTFNTWIEEVRDKPIITMSEAIQWQLLIRF